MVQVCKYKPAQRAAYRAAQVFGVSFVASMLGHMYSLTKYPKVLGSLQCLLAIVVHRSLLLGTIMAVIRFVQSAVMQLLLHMDASCISQICCVWTRWES